MKTKFTLLIISCSLVLAAPVLMAQNITVKTIYINTDSNSFPIPLTLKYHEALICDRSLGEHSLLAPGLKEKMKLTAEQRDKLKPIEDAFANTSQQYEAANQQKIDVAGDVSRQVRESKNTAQIQAARAQSQAVWAGLDPARVVAVKQIKPVLTPDQIAIMEDPQNQWRENHVHAANDPSAN
jgi:Spy/CpxP family protein refolding chaperone